MSPPARVDLSLDGEGPAWIGIAGPEGGDRLPGLGVPLPRAAGVGIGQAPGIESLLVRSRLTATARSRREAVPGKGGQAGHGHQLPEFVVRLHRPPGIDLDPLVEPGPGVGSPPGASPLRCSGLTPVPYGSGRAEYRKRRPNDRRGPRPRRRPYRHRPHRVGSRRGIRPDTAKARRSNAPSLQSVPSPPAHHHTHSNDALS